MALLRVDVGPAGFMGIDAEGEKHSVYVFLWAPIEEHPDWEHCEDMFLQDLPMAGKEWLIGRW